jgi:hypothetical protein
VLRGGVREDGVRGMRGSVESSVSEGYKLSRYVMSPAVCSKAIKVPESVEVAMSELMYVERIFGPGVNTSTHFPWFEKYARSSLSVDAGRCSRMRQGSSCMHLGRHCLGCLSGVY